MAGNLRSFAKNRGSEIGPALEASASKIAVAGSDVTTFSAGKEEIHAVR